MRLLYVVHQFMPEYSAGTERVTYALAKSAQRDGHHVDVLTRSVHGESLWCVDEDHVRCVSIDGIPVYAFPGDHAVYVVNTSLKKDENIKFRLEHFLRKRPTYDLVHVMHSMRMVDAVEAIREQSVPYIITLTDFFLACFRINLVRTSGELCSGPRGGHNCETYCPVPGVDSALIHERFNRLRDLLFSAVDVVACSQYVAEVFRGEFPDLKITVVEHGINLLRFGRPPLRDDKEVVFGCLGTISGAKGVQVLAEAFARAAPPNARLELVGPCFEPQTLKHLETIAQSSSRIVIRPPVPADQVAAALREFSILCIPSLVPETFSLVQQEGFAAGLPCLVSDLGNPARLVRELGCGQAVPPGDVHAWAEAMLEITRNPGVLNEWRIKIPLPRRVEEESFIYSQLYRRAATRSASRSG